MPQRRRRNVTGLRDDEGYPRKRHDLTVPCFRGRHPSPSPWPGPLNRQTQVMRGAGGLARFAYGVLVRTLVLIGGTTEGYCATGMFTSAGIMPPNALVWTCLAFVDT